MLLVENRRVVLVVRIGFSPCSTRAEEENLLLRYSADPTLGDPILSGPNPQRTQSPTDPILNGPNTQRTQGMSGCPNAAWTNVAPTAMLTATANAPAAILRCLTVGIGAICDRM